MTNRKLKNPKQSVRSIAFSTYEGREEPDGQQNDHKNNNGSSCNCAYTPSPIVYTKSKSKIATIVRVDIPHNNNNTPNGS